MLYIILALIAHLMNATVFMVDKGILATKSGISSPVRYAALSGLVAAGASLLLIVDYVPPTSAIIAWSLLAGVFWVSALYLFFTALSKGDPSVVVPVSGSAVPVFTLIAAAIFLGERLSGFNIIGVIVLVAGGMLLSLRWSTAAKVSPIVIGTAIFSGAMFASYFAAVKYIYNFDAPFISTFAYTRLGVGVVAFILLIFVLLKSSATPTKNKEQKNNQTKWILISAFVVSKGLAMIALVLQNYAIKLGSVTIVNALQGTQYLFLLLLALAVSKWWPKLYQKEVIQSALIQKLSGIICIGIGLILLIA
jgi:drug/metabolite transporter (DMT)-like permease